MVVVVDHGVVGQSYLAELLDSVRRSAPCAAGSVVESPDPALRA